MKIELSGKVFTGQGEGGIYVARPWVRSQIEEKLGFTPYVGTLNLKLSPDSEQQRKVLEKSASLRVCASGGCCSGIIFKASMGSLDCAVVIPEVEGYPTDVLEVISWTNLREKLHFQDGDEVTVTVKL